MISFVAMAIATIIPLVFFGVVYRLDLYKTGSSQNIIWSFMWGIAAYEIAAQVNPWMHDHGLVNYHDMVRFSAPIFEEICKALILLYLIRRANFTYFVDGAIYGFAVGIGFAIFENFEYIMGNPGAALTLAIARVLSTNLVHATGSGLIGIAFGMARFDRSFRRVGIVIGGAGLAILLHIAYNNLVNDFNSGLILVYAAAVGLGGAGVIALAIRQGLKEEKTWIIEKLGEADRVTAQEKSAVEGLDKLHKTLSPLTERFGPAKTAQVEKFLTTQARLGILRKTVDKLNDAKMRQSVQMQIESLSAEMDQARRDVGTYCMLYLRNTFLDENAGLIYSRLDTLLQERAAAAGGQAGGGQAWMKAFGSKLDTPNPENK